MLWICPSWFHGKFETNENNTRNWSIYDQTLILLILFFLQHSQSSLKNASMGIGGIMYHKGEIISGPLESLIDLLVPKRVEDYDKVSKTFSFLCWCMNSNFISKKGFCILISTVVTFVHATTRNIWWFIEFVSGTWFTREYCATVKDLDENISIRFSGWTDDGTRKTYRHQVSFLV